MRGMATCKICGRDFTLIVGDHYIADNGEKEGVFARLSSSDRTIQYDAFDCPHCGCQNIMQERKPIWLPDELINETKKHDGCMGCKYGDISADDYPCNDCRGTRLDRWEADDEEV